MRLAMPVLPVRDGFLRVAFSGPSSSEELWAVSCLHVLGLFVSGAMGGWLAEELVAPPVALFAEGGRGMLPMSDGVLEIDGRREYPPKVASSPVIRSGSTPLVPGGARPPGEDAAM